MDRRAVLAGLGATVLAPRTGWAVPRGIPAALAAVGDARFVAIGERHDNPAHHGVQAALVAALRPSAIAFEMIPRSSEEAVNRLRRAGATRQALAEAMEWEAQGWPDFDLYAPILEAAPDAYVAGGGLSHEAMAAVYTKGASGLGPEMTARYGLDESLAPAVEAMMLNEQYEAHCALLDRARLAPMVAVQRAWDAAYAEAWRRAGERGGGRAVLICGNAHARLRNGAPEYLARAMPGAAIAAIGQIEEGDTPVPDGLYTATVTSPAPARDDPCEHMRAMMGGTSE